MSHAEHAATALSADATLIALLTGGIYTYEATGRQGIGKKSTPDAYETEKPYRLKPAALVRQRSAVPDGQVYDADAQHQSYRAVVEIWVYSDANAAQPDDAAHRIWQLLHERKAGTSRFRLINWLDDERDPEMDRANFIRLDFEVAAVRR